MLCMGGGKADMGAKKVNPRIKKKIGFTNFNVKFIVIKPVF